MSQLPDDTYAEITKLCREGDSLVDSGQLEGGKAKYVDALRLLPEPRSEWEAATWIYTAIGDAHFRLGNFERCFRCFFNAVQCPGGLGNPFVHLRLGQMYFEMGELEKSADELTRAYMGGGLDIFSEDDAKYLDFLETKIEL